MSVSEAGGKQTKMRFRPSGGDSELGRRLADVVTLGSIALIPAISRTAPKLSATPFLDAAADRLVQWTGVWYFSLRAGRRSRPSPCGFRCSWCCGTWSCCSYGWGDGGGVTFP